jgi:uncharacterized protein
MRGGPGPRVAEAVWQAARPAFLAQVVGPHFESVCREFALSADTTLYGDLPAEVGSGVVNDSANRAQIEVDVVVMAASAPGERRRILSLGEATWGEIMGLPHLERLRRARDLLAVKGFDTRDTALALYSAAGFNDDLREATEGESVLLIDAARLY